uniref:Uncharacterized protein n=1 Tax=Rhizophora mucronata TaxID=61149 RepID=A0A2P2QND3_RHIMU
MMYTNTETPISQLIRTFRWIPFSHQDNGFKFLYIIQSCLLRNCGNYLEGGQVIAI